MKVKWAKRALAQLVKIEDYIAQENLKAAQEVAQNIADATKLLLENPKIGREGRVKNTFEWVVQKAPYLIAYAVQGECLVILSVIHEKRRWPKEIQ